jgi:hypothetical protein
LRAFDHRLQRLALMGHVALHRFHQSRDEIVPALELNVDLGKGVDIGVP